MTKKKIIAIVTTIVSLLLIAGIGVAAWAISSGSGKIKTDGNDIGVIVTPPNEQDANWGTLVINNPNNFKVAFDQKKIIFTDGLTASAVDGFYKLPDTTHHLSATWTLNSASDPTPNLLDGSVEFYAYIYIDNDTAMDCGKLTDYVDFVTNTSGEAWDAVHGDAKQISTSETILSSDTDNYKPGYEGRKFKLSVGSGAGYGVNVPLNGNSAANWQSGVINLEINLDNLLVYKEGKLPTTGTEENGGDMLAEFQIGLTQISNPVKVVIEAKSKDAA